ncbi:YdgA family protein [Legionella maioricensis]|uniref:YdgA family protein n=1 Tax=Legionella maioricensis TaxID=2896528 RepID=A0A9X2ICJ0_9GAMM|nr:YdgA family protein [Legionella maioricensis]MCL9684487.1 YdgA family protein [Legionella maioricensis]MCL9687919.1 YdgA family protein [Legionella maioricensis]
MKKGTALLISFLVLILIAYYVMGLIVQRTFNNNLSAIPKTSVLSIHLDKYQRGWFSSRAVLAIKMHIPEQAITDKNGGSKMDPAVDFDLGFPLIINHGPFIFTDHGIRLGMGEATTQPQTHYNVLVNYFNKTLFTYTLPSFTFKSTVGLQAFQFEWLGARAVFSIAPNMNKLDSHFTLYGLNGTGNNVLFKLGEISHHAQFTHAQNGLWLGQTDLSIPSATMSTGDKKNFDLELFRLMLGSDIAEGALNFNCDISLKKLFIDEKTYGPSSLKWGIKNLDPAAMADINQLEWTMLENNSDTNLLKLKLLAELPKLLSKGAELELSEMILNFPEGKVTGNFKIMLPQNESDPGKLLQKAHGEGQFKATIAVVKQLMVTFIEDDLKKQAEKAAQTPSSSQSGTSSTAIIAPPPSTTYFHDEAQKQMENTLQNLVSKGLLKVDGNDYVLIFKLENEQFSVNGQPFNPAMLQ